MRKNLCVIIVIAAVIAAGCLSACGHGNTKPSSDGGEGEIEIVATIFPEYDWVMNIIGENPADVRVTMLLDSGVDLHSYQPTANDILKISTCDLFIYVGGESDEWADAALKGAANKDMVVISLLDVLGDAVKEEELAEGMQGHDHDHGDEKDEDHGGGEHEHEHEHEDDDEHGGSGTEYDEHVWLSLRNAAASVEIISEAIQTIDPDNRDIYKANSSAYIEKLNALDAMYRSAVDGAAFNTLLFGDRFPFRYLTDDYGLDYYAAFAGCSAETEADFETIAFLSKKLDELSLPAVIALEGSDHRIAETIVQNTKSKNQRILVLDSMQSVAAKDVTNGATYLSIAEKNLSVLKDALN